MKNVRPCTEAYCNLEVLENTLYLSLFTNSRHETSRVIDLALSYPLLKSATIFSVQEMSSSTRGLCMCDVSFKDGLIEEEFTKCNKHG